MFLSDKRLIVAVAGVLKFFVLIIAFRSFMKLRIDHAFWILINMFQVLRIITLMNVKVGLVLRDFLNDQLKEFMIQLNINLLPKLLFSETTTESRYYTLFGIESYLCIYFIITTIIVIFATAFLLTMMLAVLECMKKTKRRLKLMIAIATYLSLNLWIRGIFEFTLTLFIVCTLDIQRAFTQSIGIVSGTSKAFALLFLIFIVTMSIIAVRYFVKHREHEKWPKGIIELYESVKPTKTSIFAYNFIFLAKRMLLAFNVTLIGKYGDTLQLSLNVVIIFAFMILCVGFVRFKCKLTMVIYLIAEFICLGSFSLMFLYQNEQQAGKMFNISITDDTVDKIIIIFVSAGMLVVMGIVFAECIAGCIRIRKQGRLSNKTKAKPPKSSRNRHLVEEDKDRSSNLDILKPQEHHEIMDVKELDQLGAVKEDESYLSKHTINAIGVNNPTQSNLNYEDIMITKHKGDIEGVEMPKSSQFNKKRMIITQDPSNL